MRSDSSGLLESLAAGLFCIVALVALHRHDTGAPCRAEPTSMAAQRAAPPGRAEYAAVEAGIQDMLLHD